MKLPNRSIVHFLANIWLQSFRGPLPGLFLGVLLQGAGATALSAPANDNFASAQPLSGLSATVSGNNLGATRESGEREHGYRSVWYSWTAPANVQVTVTTKGSGFSTIVAVYQGDALDRLNLVAAEKEGSPRVVSFPAVQGTVFRIAVAAVWATDSNNTVGLTLATTPLVLSGTLAGPAAPVANGPANDSFLSPQALSGTLLTVIGYNGDATAEVPVERAHGERTVWYTWTAPADATVTIQTSGSAGTRETGFSSWLSVYMGETLDRLNRVASDYTDDRVVTFPAARGTVFRIAVGDIRGRDLRDSDNAIVMTITTAPLASSAPVVGAAMPVERGPANDGFSSPQVLTGAQLTVVAYNGDATVEAPAERAHGERTVWYQWTAPTDVQVSMVVEGDGFAEKLAVYMGESLEGLNRVADDLDGKADVSFPAAAGTTFRIALGSIRTSDWNSTTLLRLTTTPWARSVPIVGPGMPTARRPANDHFDAAQVLTGTALTAVGYNGDATLEAPRERAHGQRTFWYAWTAPANLEVTLSTRDSKSRTALTVYLGDAYERLNVVAASTFSTDTVVVFRAAAGVTYRIATGTPTTREDLAAAVLNLTSRPWPTSGPLLAPQMPANDFPPNDSFANARPLSGSKLSVLGYPGNATTETLEPRHGSNTLWYTWRAAANGTATLDAGGSTAGQGIYVYEGPDLGRLTRTAYDTGSTTAAAKLTFSTRAGVTYRIMLTTGSGAASAVLNLQGPGTSQFALPGTYLGFVGSGVPRGLLQVVTSRVGTLSARLTFGASVVAVSGKWDAAGNFVGTAARKNLPPLQIALHADLASETGGITGTVTEAGVNYPVELEISGYTASNPTPDAGRYTVLIEPDPTATDPATQPLGFGYGLLTVSTAGLVSFSGKLPDGTPFAQRTYLTAAREWPLFVPLHGGAGAISGRVTFRDQAGSTDLDGVLIWSRPAIGTAAYYRQGFTVTVGLGGSRYTAVPGVFLQQSLTATLDYGNLPVARSVEVPRFVRDRSVPPPTIKYKASAGDLKLSINRANGLLSGSFLHPVTRKATLVSGVIFARQNAAAGYFLGKDQAGSFELTE